MTDRSARARARADATKTTDEQKASDVHQGLQTRGRAPVASPEGAPAHTAPGEQGAMPPTAGQQEETVPLPVTAQSTVQLLALLAAQQVALDEAKRQALAAQAAHAALAGLNQVPVAQPSPVPSPGASPESSPRQSSRFAKKEPRAQDLREYDGAPGPKLDDWLDELGAAVELFELNDGEAVRFGASRLRDAARLWWNSLGVAGKAAIVGTVALASAMRARFQPVTAARVARDELDRLSQGTRPINAYIADFQKLRARLSSMTEADALHAFERGLRRDIAVDLRKQRVDKLDDAISLASHIGSIGASTPSSNRPGVANQMEIDHGDGSALESRVAQAVLNALHARDKAQGAGASGLGAKMQTQRGYQQQGGRGGVRAGAGRFPSQPPQIPGIPEELVQQRWTEKLCLRCGSADHRAMACPNGISTARGPSSSSAMGN